MHPTVTFDTAAHAGNKSPLQAGHQDLRQPGVHEPEVQAPEWQNPLLPAAIHPLANMKPK